MEPIKWLYFDITKARFVDDDDPVTYLESSPSSVLVEVHVMDSNPLPSGTGVGLIPETFPALLRQNSELYEISISGSADDNLYIVSSGSVIQAGFLPLDGGEMQGDLILDHDPVQSLEAATKQYVDNEIKERIVLATADIDLSVNSYTSVICDASSQSIEVSLPDVVTASGTIYSIKRVDNSGFIVTITGSAPGEVIDGSPTKVIETQYDSLRILPDGVGWHII